jgi:hypothetical protein
VVKSRAKGLDEIPRASSPEARGMTSRREIISGEKGEAGLKDQRYIEEGRKKEEEEAKSGPPPKAGPTGSERALAEMEVVERIGEALLEALVKSGYVGPRKTELAEEKLRRMLRRFSMEAADAEVFLGMMKKIVEGMK